MLKDFNILYIYIFLLLLNQSPVVQENVLL